MRGRVVLGGLVCVGVVACGPVHGGAGSAPSTAPVAVVRPMPFATTAAGPPAVGHAMYVAPAQVDPSCASSTAVDISPGRPPDTKLPVYGFGAGPAYLSGQIVAAPGQVGSNVGHAVWYASGEGADVVVAPSYTTPVSVTGHRLDGSGAAHFGGAASVTVAPEPPHSWWRYWMGTLSFDSPGCYRLDFSGPGLSEHVVVQAAPGQPPPG